jgi:hypothetical protein
VNGGYNSLLPDWGYDLLTSFKSKLTLKFVISSLYFLKYPILFGWAAMFSNIFSRNLLNEKLIVALQVCAK